MATLHEKVRLCMPTRLTSCAWLSTSVRLLGPMVATDCTSPQLVLFELTVDTTLKAVIELHASAAERGVEEYVPLRLVLGGVDETFELGASSAPSSLVFTELTRRAGSLLVCLETVAAHERLPRLVAWVAALRDLFSAACHHCGRMLAAVGTNPAHLLPPVVRTVDLEPYHPRCYESCFGLRDVAYDWCTNAQTIK
mmetsp:Transcript_34480/g.73570  ORF Transcript_34480/g.73570 Transcript_34480/m.73570 type:complete len:196 (-) Transcript_34480:99-686(-)|eukprot:CAMPEP_0183332400 /NCGR_PEP_ID=MMETSP0164_2-20130417/1579_1 /TAXON_ID=221442 /ORGANISM="Coccolithus pelagicus ssp braarudi, Strain PLY182g" /LENGTH=195 /DNA_ID=CAMNT_0025501107 /DNA_START=119 /DNA_END=706 /DNA_ORIENTATION=+